MKDHKKENNSEQDFFVVVPDSKDVGKLEKLAKDENIKVFKKGKKQHWMHFRCPPSEWATFYKEISARCYVQTPLPCPAGFKRAFRRKSRKKVKIRYKLKRIRRIIFKGNRKKKQTQNRRSYKIT